MSARGWSGVSAPTALTIERLPLPPAGPMFIELSLLVEGLSWMVRAIERLPKLPRRRPARNADLRGARRVLDVYERRRPEDRRAFERSLELALEIGDFSYALGVLGMLNILLQRIGDYQAALTVAERGAAIAEGLGDPVAIMVSQWTLGVSHHLSGDQARSQVSCETALLPKPTSTGARALRFLGYDHRVRALVIETITLWLRGYHDRAVRAAQLTIEEAERAGQPIPMCVSYLTQRRFCWMRGTWRQRTPASIKSSRTAENIRCRRSVPPASASKA